MDYTTLKFPKTDLLIFILQGNEGEQVATQNTFKLYILHLTFLMEGLHLAENKGLAHY